MTITLLHGAIRFVDNANRNLSQRYYYIYKVIKINYI